MAGLSAGSLCWFEGGTTDSFGPGLAPLHDGLGLHRRAATAPHYDGEPARRPHLPAARRRRRRCRAGYAADDGAALVFHGTGARRGRGVATGGARLPGRTRTGRRGDRDASCRARYLG